MSDQIQISLNGTQKEVQNNLCVAELIDSENISGRFLVVVNDMVLSKQSHKTTYLYSGDRVDILSPISGG